MLIQHFVTLDVFAITCTPLHTSSKLHTNRIFFFIFNIICLYTLLNTPSLKYNSIFHAIQYAAFLFQNYTILCTHRIYWCLSLKINEVRHILYLMMCNKLNCSTSHKHFFKAYAKDMQIHKMDIIIITKKKLK